MVKAKKTDTKIIERDYTVLVAPHVTEKSALGAQHNQVTFRVTPEATKPQIKRAVESLWGVTVKSVNTITTKGKQKRFRGVIGTRSDVKKAIVTLAEGQTIDLGTGV